MTRHGLLAHHRMKWAICLFLCLTVMPSPVPAAAPQPDPLATAKPMRLPSPLRLNVPAPVAPPTSGATDLVPTTNLPVAASLPIAQPLFTTKPADTITLADLRGRLQMTPDTVWLQRQRLFVIELLTTKLSSSNAPGGTAVR